MTKIISPLAMLAVLAAATASCSSNKVKTTADSDSLERVEETAPLATDSVADSIPTDSSSISQ